MEGSNVMPVVGEGKVVGAQYADNGAVLYQEQGKHHTVLPLESSIIFIKIYGWSKLTVIFGKV